MRKRRFITTIFLLLLVFVMSPFNAFAAREWPQDTIQVSLKNIPDNAEYIDMLIKIDDSDEKYTQENTDNLKQIGFDKQKLIDYNSDGFVSVSAHFKLFYTNMKINNSYKPITFAPVEPPDSSAQQYPHSNTVTRYQRLVDNYNEVKLIVLDAEGNVIRESKSFSIKQTDQKQLSDILYDIKTNEVKAVFYEKQKPFPASLSYMFLFVVLLIIILVAVLIWFIIMRLCKAIAKHKQAAR